MTRPLLSLLAATGLLSLTGTALAIVQPEAGLGLPRDVSTEGYRIDSLIHSVSPPIILIFLIMVGWMVIAMVKHNRNHKAEYDHGTGHHSVVSALIISSVIFLGIDGWLFVNSMIDLDEALWAWPEDAQSLKIEVNAQQWAWGFRYAGPDGSFNSADDIVTLNDLRVPVDTNVMFRMTAKDVIHSLYLPNLRVKADAIPGNVTQTWFRAKETGEFDIGCAQHCGTHHYAMKGKVTILSKQDYETWHKEQTAIARVSYDADDIEAHWGWNWEVR
jgi:cytochrome c oxidase subunit 2